MLKWHEEVLKLYKGRKRICNNKEKKAMRNQNKASRRWAGASSQPSQAKRAASQGTTSQVSQPSQLSQVPEGVTYTEWRRGSNTREMLTCPANNVVVGIETKHEGGGTTTLDQWRRLVCAQVPNNPLREETRHLSTVVSKSATGPVVFGCPANEVLTGITFRSPENAPYAHQEEVQVQCASLAFPQTSNAQATPLHLKSSPVSIWCPATVSSVGAVANTTSNVATGWVASHEFGKNLSSQESDGLVCATTQIAPLPEPEPEPQPNPTPETKNYKCITGKCTEVGVGYGDYTLNECSAQCMSTNTYKCVEGKCQFAEDGKGEYSSGDCNNKCTPTLLEQIVKYGAWTAIVLVLLYFLLTWLFVKPHKETSS